MAIIFNTVNTFNTFSSFKTSNNLNNFNTANILNLVVGSSIFLNSCTSQTTVMINLWIAPC